MPRRKTEPEQDDSGAEVDVQQEPEQDDPSTDEGIAPLVDGAPVSSAARHNVRYPAD